MAEKALEERFTEAGRSLANIGRAMEGYRQLSVAVVGLSVRGPRVRGDEYLLVVKGLSEDGGPLVAFLSAISLDELFRSADAKLSNGTLKWRDDQFAGNR